MVANGYARTYQTQAVLTARRLCFCRMICVSYNLKRLFTLKNLAAVA